MRSAESPRSTPGRGNQTQRPWKTLRSSPASRSFFSPFAWPSTLLWSLRPAELDGRTCAGRHGEDFEASLAQILERKKACEEATQRAEQNIIPSDPGAMLCKDTELALPTGED